MKNIMPGINERLLQKAWLIVLVLATAGGVAQERYQVIIRNGKIIDGTGNSWFYGDVAIQNGRIARIGKLGNATAARIIDAKGLIVAPGFIDVHTHIESDEVKNPTADNFIYDGVTTVVTGNCGASRVNIGQYLQMIDSLRTSINVATLIGHNDVRRAVMGNARRDPSENELQQMEALVEQAMREGAVGLSTGLIYIPGTYSKTGEIVRLARIAARFDGVYASHMRNEGDSVTQAIEEALAIGRAANIPVEISHFKVSGQQNWGRSKETVALLDQARKEGIEVTIDQYPYTASSTGLSTLIPDEVMADGSDSVNARLRRPAIRQQVIDYMLKKLKQRNLHHFSYAVVAYYKADTTLNGKSIEEINRLKGRRHRAKEEAETVIEMMLNGGASMVFHGMSESDVQYIMRYPFNMFASDASIRVFGQGAPHPRGYGTNARVLSYYVRHKKVLSLEEAIRRMTSLPAQKFQLWDRGLLREGMAADIVVFDENAVQDRSTFQQPHQYSTGFRYVLVNGQLTVDNGTHLGIRAGKPLYGKGSNNSQ